MIYLQLFFSFLKVGAFAFGGGYAMLSLIGDSVLKYGWMTEQELLNFVGVETIIPGPIAVNMATYIGYEQGGFLGALLATVGVVLPSFIVILVVAAFIKNGWCLTANTLESHNSAEGCILSDILMQDVPDKYFLSEAAMRKILKNSSLDHKDNESTKQTE